MGFVAGQGACGRSDCSKALDSIAIGLRQGTTPQAASRPAPLQGSHHNHKVRYWLPLEGSSGESRWGVVPRAEPDKWDLWLGSSGGQWAGRPTVQLPTKGL